MSSIRVGIGRLPTRVVWGAIRVSIGNPSSPAVPKAPPTKQVDPKSGTRYHYFSDVPDLYIDDVQVIHTAISEACGTVIMESNEYSKITMDNIADIKLEQLTGFSFIGRNPDIYLKIGPRDFSSLSVSGEYEKIDPIFEQLERIMMQRTTLSHRLTKLPSSVVWALGMGVLAIVLIILSGRFSPPLMTIAYSVCALALIYLMVVPVFFGPFPVVYPVWKRDAHPRLRIDWRHQSVELVRSLIVLIVGFLLGRYL